MSGPLTAAELEALGLAPEKAASLARALAELWREPDVARRWALLTEKVLSPAVPSAVHCALFARNYADWDASCGPAPSWSPTQHDLEHANLRRVMDRVGAQTCDEFAQWAFEDPGRFWLTMVETIGIRFETPPSRGVDLARGSRDPQWLPGARLNIALSCFARPPDAPALITQNEAGRSQKFSTRELEILSHQFAGALAQHGIRPGDAVALVMPLTAEAVVAYLGTILAGAVAVCIADSFAASEVERRLRIAKARLVITQDVVVRAGKTLPLYEKLRSGVMPAMVVAPAAGAVAAALRKEDMTWEAFLASGEPAPAVIADPADTMTLLFSSGTTADPKAIVWPQTAPIKCVVDGFLYQDIHPTDVVTWPTSMGWMMGPWLIFAGMVNRATVALFDGHPASPEFARFVESAGVTVLGVIPSLVTAWNSSGAWGGADEDRADWSRVRLLSSTGECSRPEQMLALSARCGYRPIIEYCGGTEIGGGYLASTVLRPIAPSHFNQAAFGLRLLTFDEAGQAARRGEMYLSGSAMGLSTRLVNGDHDATYYAGAPRDEQGEPLRRHGDEIEALPKGYYRVLGRADDAMNLGGIKVAAVEIEHVLDRHPAVAETAAVAVSDQAGGPARLAVFAVAAGAPGDVSVVQRELQELLRNELNPLFHIWRLEWIDELPRTASNKMMRRRLRDRVQCPSEG